MKATRKKLLCLSLAAMLVAGLFAACGGGATSSATSTSPASTASSTASSSPAESSAAEEPGERYTISWTGYQTAPLGDDPFMLEYFEEKFNVDFDIWNIDNQQYEELLNVRLASGEIPDMFMVRQPSDLTKYVQQDLLAPIPYEMIQQKMPNTLQVSYTDTNPGALDLGKINGEIYGLPAMNMGNIHRLPIVYNQDWLNTLGMQVPTTIDEFEEVIYAFANNDPDGNGTKDTYGLSNEGLNILWGMYNMVPNQDYFYDKDGKLVFMPIEPEMKEALTYANKWYQDGVLDPEFITGENTGGYWAISHSYINQRIGMTVIGNYYHWLFEGTYNDLVDGAEVPNEDGSVAKELHALHPDAQIVFGEPLINKDGVQGGVRAYNILMRFYGIGADVQDVPGKMEKILEIYEYCSDAQPDDTAFAEVRSGFEGEHWQWAERDRRTYVTLGALKDDDSLRYQWGSILWWSSGNKNYTDRRSEWASANGFEEGGIYSAMPTSVDAMAKYNANLQTLREQAYIQIITGEKPIDYFDEFVEQYLAQGGQEILDQANEWYAGTK